MSALYANVTGNDNTAVGHQSLPQLEEIIGVGSLSLALNTSGEANTAIADTL